MSRRNRRATGERGPATTDTLPPPPVKPETIRTVIDAVGALESMGDAAFEKLLEGYRDVEAAKGGTFAYAWLVYNLDHHAGPTAQRAIAAAGVLAVHRARQVEAEASAEKLARVEWLRWAAGRMADRLMASCVVRPGRGRQAARRERAFDRLLDALAREAS